MDRGTWQAGLQSIELKRVGRDWATNTFTSWLLRSVTLTWGGHIQSYSTRMTIPPTLRCPKASCLMDSFCCIIFLCVLLKIRSGQGAFSIAHRALSGCTKCSLTFEWFWIALCILPRLIWSFLQCRWVSFHIWLITYPTERTHSQGFFKKSKP